MYLRNILKISEEFIKLVSDCEGWENGNFKFPCSSSEIGKFRKNNKKYQCDECFLAETQKIVPQKLFEKKYIDNQHRRKINITSKDIFTAGKSLLSIIEKSPSLFDFNCNFISNNKPYALEAISSIRDVNDKNYLFMVSDIVVLGSDDTVESEQESLKLLKIIINILQTKYPAILTINPKWSPKIQGKIEIKIDKTPKYKREPFEQLKNF